jgi:hypothetical protein
MRKLGMQIVPSKLGRMRKRGFGLAFDCAKRERTKILEEA